MISDISGSEPFAQKGAIAVQWAGWILNCLKALRFRPFKADSYPQAGLFVAQRGAHLFPCSSGLVLKPRIEEA